MIGALFKLGLRRPYLVPALVRAAWVFRRRGWYRHPPFLPVPSAQYLRWRSTTAYGSEDADPAPEELARFLRWAFRLRRGG